MKAQDTKISLFLEGRKQFIVPLFQRTYSWRIEHITAFWDDIQETKDEINSTHFFGSFVTLPILSPAAAVSKYLIIDGQQRLVTLSVFLASLRERIVEIDKESQLSNEIYKVYLINEFDKPKFKIIPTQADQAILFSIIDKPYISLQPYGSHLLLETYNFFKNRLSKIRSIEELTALQNTLLRRFLVVDICLDRDDDPYLIFESLNATGSPLTQADLVRNFLFMKLLPQSQQKVYDEIWFPMQETLKDSLEAYFRHYLAMDGNIPNYNKIYSTFIEHVETNTENENEIIELMKNLALFATYYDRFSRPLNEPEEVLRQCFEKLNRLEVTTAHPLLLRLYEDYDNRRLSLDDFFTMLTMVETYIVRRAVCGIPTNALNRYLPTIYKNLDPTSRVSSLKTKLQSERGSRRYPNDQEFKTSLLERRLYGNRILKYLLEEIEKHNNKETVNFEELQVEHIMPQTLTEDWKKTLGTTWELTHQKYLDTLGNLTLTGYNPEYSNKSFIEKRDMSKGFKDSGLKINRDLEKLSTWTEKEIKGRAEALSKIAMKIFSL